jgi:hypothetical protein
MKRGYEMKRVAMRRKKSHRHPWFLTSVVIGQCLGFLMYCVCQPSARTEEWGDVKLRSQYVNTAQQRVLCRSQFYVRDAP